MKNNYLYNWVMIVFMMLQMLVSTSCSDDDDNSGWPTEAGRTEIFIERFSTLMTDLTALWDEATYGELKGNYPVSSKAILDGEIVYLEETITKLKEGSKKLADSEADRVTREAGQMGKNFRAARRTEGFLPVTAKLLVNEKNGGYIGFGVHPEYSIFGEQGQQTLTVEFWMKLTDVDEYLNSFVPLLPTFADDNTRDHERRGWAVNSHLDRLRMTYDIGYSDLFEPGFSFSTLNQRVHVAVVTSENGVDGEARDGIPVMIRIYVNDQLMLSKRGRDDRLPCTPDDKEMAMVASTGFSATTNRIEGKSVNGCVHHLYIWKLAKTQVGVQHLVDIPEPVTGSESDLVCGQTLNKTISDNNNIKDLTGKFPARLIGDFQWTEDR